MEPGGSMTKPLTIRNSGVIDVTLEKIELVPDTTQLVISKKRVPYIYSSNNVKVVIPAKGTINVNITCNPTSCGLIKGLLRLDFGSFQLNKEIKIVINDPILAEALRPEAPYKPLPRHPIREATEVVDGEKPPRYF